VLSSPVTQSVEPFKVPQEESATTEIASSDDVPAETSSVPDARESAPDVANLQSLEVVSTPIEQSHVVEVTKSTDEGVTKGTFLAVSSISMGRSSR